MIFIASLVLLLIIKLRFPKGKSIHRVKKHWYNVMTHTSFVQQSKCVIHSQIITQVPTRWKIESYTVINPI